MTWIFLFGMVAGAAVALTVREAWDCREERAEFRAWEARDQEFDQKHGIGKYRVDAGGM